MCIEVIVNDNKTIIKVSGRIDTSTAAELDTTITGYASKVEELELDCSNLSYMSSAGLRVLLKTHKLMHNRGVFRITHVNEFIMTILDAVGFSDILVIE